ncbi:hypothetical protein ACJMK2_030534, partial [Sinanodonta woodiana]
MLEVSTETLPILFKAFPSNLSLTYGGNTDFDLARSSVTLQCQTDTCTYPAPRVKWYSSVSTVLETKRPLKPKDYHGTVLVHK